MRLNEFANAQAQLDLLRIIIDNTWSAIAQQAEQQKRAQAAQQTLVPRPRLKRSAKKNPNPPTNLTPPTKPKEADISPKNITANTMTTGGNLTPVVSTTKKYQPLTTPAIDTNNSPTSPNELVF